MLGAGEAHAHTETRRGEWFRAGGRWIPPDHELEVGREGETWVGASKTSMHMTASMCLF